jgi:hypothetical protein
MEDVTKLTYSCFMALRNMATMQFRILSKNVKIKIYKIITLLGMAGWTTGVQFPVEGNDEFFPSTPRSDRFCGPPSLLSNRYRGRGTLSSEVKRLERDPKHSPQSIAKFKKAWSYTSNTPYVFMALYLVKNRIVFMALDLVKSSDFTLSLPRVLGMKYNFPLLF